MSTVDPMADKPKDDEEHVCFTCQLRNALTDWRDSGGPVDDVVGAINDMIHSVISDTLDEIFSDEEPKDVTAHPAGHG